MKETIRIPAMSSGFQEDKDFARELRMEKILPILAAGNHIVLDFGEVKYSTQSFVHALIGEALKQYGENVLDRIEFKGCSPQLQNLISLVVDYTLGGFVAQPQPSVPTATVS